MVNQESKEIVASKSVVVERFQSPLPTGWDAKENLDHQDKNYALRPNNFANYPGQKKVKENLKVYVRAARKRESTLDHVILHGPPGLGKTTLAHIIARELGVPFFSTSGPSIDKPGDLAGILAGLEKGSLLFIDEIHRLSVQVEEVLYSAMEDFSIDIVIGQGPTARSVSIEISPFTLVGATTKLSSLSRPFLSRFGIQERLEYYEADALVEILEQNAKIYKVDVSREGAEEIAKRSRGTPRIANRLFSRAWDFAEVRNSNEVDIAVVKEALYRLDIDTEGLDRIDRTILETIYQRYQGGPVGIDTLAVSIGEEKATIEEVYEPFLVHQGFLTRGPRGRSLTEKGKMHLDGQIN